MRAPFLVAASCGLAAALFVVPPSSHAQSKPPQQMSVSLKTGDVNFTLWRFSKGGDAATLFVTAGGKTHRVNTAQVGPASNRRGSGNATFTPNGTGGAFVIDFVADTGAEITGLITCSAFAKAEDNGR
jgi:hypothetical protein